MSGRVSQTVRQTGVYASGQTASTALPSTQATARAPEPYSGSQVRLREVASKERADVAVDANRRRKSSERRSLAGRGAGRGHGSEDLQADATSIDLRFLLPECWWMMAPLLVAVVVLAGFVTWRMPAPLTLGLTALAAALAGAGQQAALLERRENLPVWIRSALYSVSALLPLGLVCGIIANWMFTGALSPYWGIASIIMLSGVAGAFLFGRIASMVLAQIICWLPATWMSGSLLAAGGLALYAIMLCVIGVFHFQYQKQLEHARQKRERVSHRAEDILRDYEETGQGWFWETDRRGLLTYLSDGVARTLNRDKFDLLSSQLTELFDLGDENRDGERTLTFHLSTRSSFQELAVRAASSQEERWWAVSGRPVYDSFRNFVGFRGSGMDLTEQRRSQESESRLAHYDSLTGLANRFQMSQLLEKILGSPQAQQRECAVLLLDLDRFKQVNDTLGHPAGDALLKQVAQRLERTVGSAGRVGRLGGDEFKVIVAGRPERDTLGRLTHEIIESLSQPYSIEGQRVVIGASIGIALCPHDGTSSESLIRNADLALYAAKDGGRGRYHFYSDDLHSAAEERSALEQDLRDAIAAGQLELYYQPVVSTKTEKISGFEALLRWQHPQKGWLSPAKFIPIAEDTGLVIPIGEWALRTACHQLAEWPDEIRCAVNVSPLQFANPNLPTIVTSAISQAGIDPGRLELEITETVFLGDSAGTSAMFAALKGIGVRLALDDFGTGYSSLGYLKKAPFDKIKIDQSFVRGATEDGSPNGAIITAIASLAKALGMDTTAEGVETLDELDLIRSLGCTHIQGYIYDKARSAKDSTARLAQGLDAVASGPRSARTKRRTVLRKVLLENGGQYYNATIRNINAGGAMVEGLWNVPPGTPFNIALSETFNVKAKSLWAENDRIGVEFDTPLRRDAHGAILGLPDDQLDSVLRIGG